MACHTLSLNLNAIPKRPAWQYMALFSSVWPYSTLNTTCATHRLVIPKETASPVEGTYNAAVNGSTHAGASAGKFLYR